MPRHSLPDSGFDRAAWFYDALAQLVFGSSILNAQLHFLHQVPDGAHVLIIGGGTGRLLQALLHRTSGASVVYLEASPRMLEQAQQLVQADLQRHPARVEFRLGTEASLLPHEQFNIIITPFILDLFLQPRVEQLIHQLHRQLQPGGRWLHTDFSYRSTSRVLWQKLLMQLMYRFFRLLCGIEGNRLVNFEAIFEKTGLKRVAAKNFYQGMIEAVVYAKRES